MTPSPHIKYRLHHHSLLYLVTYHYVRHTFTYISTSPMFFWAIQIIFGLYKWIIYGVQREFYECKRVCFVWIWSPSISFCGIRIATKFIVCDNKNCKKIVKNKESFKMWKKRNSWKINMWGFVYLKWQFFVCQLNGLIIEMWLGSKVVGLLLCEFNFLIWCRIDC